MQYLPLVVLTAAVFCNAGSQHRNRVFVVLASLLIVAFIVLRRNFDLTTSEKPCSR
jgi:hypothetical protein